MGSAFDAALSAHSLPPLRRERVTTLQVNVTRRCNLSCHHCHVESGPNRREALNASGASRLLTLLAANPQLETLDLTGGAPELWPHFRSVVQGARRLGRRVIDRCNLTVLFEPGQENTADFLASNRVEVVASLPCYSAENVEAQRGKGVFGQSIEALQRLNALGYGQPGSPLRLVLVYNPLGATLPPAQEELEVRYRAELRALFGIEFHQLATITNMPIKRFAHTLLREGRHDEYLALLVAHFNPATVRGLMCRQTLSVGHDGTLHDCDFNQMLDLPLGAGPRTIYDLEDLTSLEGAPVATAPHCFGCTAGAGSSCTGALTPN